MREAGSGKAGMRAVRSSTRQKTQCFDRRGVYKEQLLSAME